MCSQALDGVVGARLLARLVDARAQRAVDDVVHQRRFAAAGNAGDHDEQAQRKLDVDVLEVVLARAANHQASCRCRGAAPAGVGMLQRAGKILAGERRGVALRSGLACPRPPARRPAGPRPGPGRSRSRRARWSRRRAPPPAPCCPGRAAGPACRAGARCRAGAARWRARRARRARRAACEPICVARRMRCGFAAGKRGRRAVQAQVVEPHGAEEFQPVADFVQHAPGDLHLALGELPAVQLRKRAGNRAVP